MISFISQEKLKELILAAVAEKVKNNIIQLRSDKRYILIIPADVEQDEIAQIVNDIKEFVKNTDLKIAIVNNSNVKLLEL